MTVRDRSPTLSASSVSYRHHCQSFCATPGLVFSGEISITERPVGLDEITTGDITSGF